MSLETLLDERRLGRVDLLKVDIEGLEHEALGASPALARAGLVVGELHPELLTVGRPACARGPASARRFRALRAERAHLRARPRARRSGADLNVGLGTFRADGVGTSASASHLRSDAMDLAQHAAVLWRFRAVVGGRPRAGRRARRARGVPASVLVPARGRDLEQRVLAARSPSPAGP